jgi:perosamine synthetase
VIPLAVPNLSGREAIYLQECITSTFVSSVGPFVDRLEEQVAAAAGVAGCVAVSAGTTGLHLALHTVGVRAGDLVVLPSLTFIASANAIAHCGASPWLFDVSASSATLDPEQLTTTLHARLVRHPDGAVDRVTGRRVAAILPVHTLGHPADMDAIVEVGREYRIPVVADAAAALGATYRGRPIGRTGAEVSVFSFNGNKTVTAGGGGALVSDDETLLARARHLSTTARIGRDYDHDEVGFNYRMTNLQAAVGAAQMEQLETFVASKRRIQRFYEDRLAHHPAAAALPQAAWGNSACWFAGLLLEGLTSEEVDEVRTALRADGIDARPFWKPMHLQRPFANTPCEPTPVTDRLWPRVLTLPCSTGITDDELHQVADAADRALKPWTP